jgi:hypothetical protein
MSCAKQLMTLYGSQTFADGYCTQGCVEDLDCGSGGSCVGAVSALRARLSVGCYKNCTADGDCRKGYRCGAVSTGMNGTEQRNVCVPLMPETDADAGAADAR